MDNAVKMMMLPDSELSVRRDPRTRVDDIAVTFNIAGCASRLPLAGDAGLGAPPGAEAWPVTWAFRRAPGGAVRRQDPPAGSL